MATLCLQLVLTQSIVVCTIPMKLIKEIQIEIMILVLHGKHILLRM